ncbi:MAG: hypothetical protein AMXMBFR82_35640 [Candidatus Hydrogenedentota bacterium]
MQEKCGSEFLNRRALRALERMGDLVVPRVGKLPSFTDLGCIEHVDSVLAYAPPEDSASLRTLLNVLYFAPSFVLRFLLRAMANPDRYPEFLAANFRLIDMGVRGVVLSLYYSGKTGTGYTGQTPHELMGYDVTRVPLDTIASATR